MKGSLIIISFFALGIGLGASGRIPTEWVSGDWSFMTLCALMFFVGMTIGHDPDSISRFRTLNPRLALLPVMTIAGTLTGCLAVGLLLPHRTVSDCMAVGTGFAYYSLSSIFITEYRGAELGIVALLSNIGREVLTLLAAPLMVRWFGNLAPISSGGATSMDTTLPVITRYSGQELVIVSLYHGFVVDFSVPFLVTFFCSVHF